MNIKDFLGIAELKKSLDELHGKVDIMLYNEHYVSRALEEAVQKVTLRAVSIDQKVPNKTTKPK